MPREPVTARRIAADLRRRSVAGSTTPATNCPAAACSWSATGLARQTVQKAVAQLQAEGIVIGCVGAGWFVREKPAVLRLARNRLSRDERNAGRGTFTTDATSGGWTPTVDVTVRTESADERTATELHIPPGEETLVRQRVMSADSQPIQLAISRLPRSITEGTTIEAENTGPGAPTPALKRPGTGCTTSLNGSPAASLPTTKPPHCD